MAERRRRRSEEYESESEHADPALLAEDSTVDDTKETLETEEDSDEYVTEEEETAEEDNKDEGVKKAVVVDGERQSGDGEEQPKLDDDEDRKNPAYIPRKGTFYEHDLRLDPVTEGGDVPREDKRLKGKLWKDETKWFHDKFDSHEQAPKSRQELVASYGYDITQHDQPPEVLPRRGGRGRYDGRNRKPQFQDFLPETINQRSYPSPNKDRYSSEGYEDEPHMSRSDSSQEYRGMKGQRRFRGTTSGRGRYSNTKADFGPGNRFGDQSSDSSTQKNRGHGDEYSRNNNSFKNQSYDEDPNYGFKNKYQIKEEDNESKNRDNYRKGDLNEYSIQDKDKRENNANSNNRSSVNLEEAPKSKFGNDNAFKHDLQERIGVQSEIKDQVDRDNYRDQRGSDRGNFKDRKGSNRAENVDNLTKPGGVISTATHGPNAPGHSEKPRPYSQRRGSGGLTGKQNESKEMPSEPPACRLKTEDRNTASSYGRSIPKSYYTLSATDDEKLMGDMDEDYDQTVPPHAMQDLNVTVTGDKRSFNKDNKGVRQGAPPKSQDIAPSARQSSAEERREPIQSQAKQKSHITGAPGPVMKHQPSLPPRLQHQQQQQQQELKRMKQQQQQQLPTQQPLAVDKQESLQNRSNKRYSSQRQRSGLESPAFVESPISQPQQLITSPIPQQFQAIGQSTVQNPTIMIPQLPPSQAMFVAHTRPQIPTPTPVPGPQAPMGAPPVFVPGTLASTVIPQVSVLGAPPPVSVLGAPPPVSVLGAPPPLLTPAGMIYATPPPVFQVPVPQFTAAPHLPVQAAETVHGGTTYYVQGTTVSATPSTGTIYYSPQMQIIKQQHHVQLRRPKVPLQIVNPEELKRGQDSENDNKQDPILNKSPVKSVQEISDTTEDDPKILLNASTSLEVYINESLDDADTESSVLENVGNVEDDKFVYEEKDGSENVESNQYKSENVEDEGSMRPNFVVHTEKLSPTLTVSVEVAELHPELEQTAKEIMSEDLKDVSDDDDQENLVANANDDILTATEHLVTTEADANDQTEIEHLVTTEADANDQTEIEHLVTTEADANDQTEIEHLVTTEADANDQTEIEHNTNIATMGHIDASIEHECDNSIDKFGNNEVGEH